GTVDTERPAGGGCRPGTRPIPARSSGGAVTSLGRPAVRRGELGSSTVSPHMGGCRHGCLNRRPGDLGERVGLHRHLRQRLVDVPPAPLSVYLRFLTFP